MKKTIILASAVALALVSCNKITNLDAPQKNEVGVYSDNVKVTVADFISDDGTKATVTNKGVFNWSSGDEIGIWPMSVDPGQVVQQHMFTTTSEGSATTTFSGSGWALRTDGSHQYSAYYPYSSTSAEDEVSVSYPTYQYQSANANIEHVYPFLYMHADPITPSDPAGCSFTFNQLGCLLQFEMTGLSGQRVNDIKISFTSPLIGTNCTYDPTSNTPVLTPTVFVRNMIISVNRSVSNVTGEGLCRAFAVVAPSSVKDQRMTVTVQTNTAKYTQTYVCGKNWEAGKLYRYDLTMAVDASAPSTTKEGVDLGTGDGIKWATMNVGASSNTDPGYYIAWGGLADRIANASRSSYDSGATLVDADDVVKNTWGGNWRMPTSVEINALINRCTWTEECVDGIYGVKISNNNDASKYIFVPYGGSSGGNGNANRSLFIWSSTKAGAATAYYIQKSFESAAVRSTHNIDLYFNIRPVLDN